MISEPASPNPTASKPQIFAIEFSNSRVSICESSRYLREPFLNDARPFKTCRVRLRANPSREKNSKTAFPKTPRREPFPSSRLSAKWASSSASPSLSSLLSSTANRLSGFSETSLTFLTMRSMGFKTSACASRLKNSAPAPSIKHTNTVRHMFSAACVRVATRASKKAYDGTESTGVSACVSGSRSATYAASRNSSQRSLRPKSAPGSVNAVSACASKLSPYTTSAYKPSAPRQYWSTAP